VRINILINSSITLAICLASLTLSSNTTILIGLTVALLTYVLLNFLTVIQKLRAADTSHPHPLQAPHLGEGPTSERAPPRRRHHLGEGTRTPTRTHWNAELQFGQPPNPAQPHCS